VFHGKGGYDWETIYNMPIWLRKFTFHKLKEWYDKENNQEQNDVVEQSIKNMKSAGATAKSTKVQPPTYITKASKK
jgi:hypothetical protein